MLSNSPWMTMRNKAPKYNLRRENKGVDVEPLAISNSEETLMHSHDGQQGNIPLRHASSRVL